MYALPVGEKDLQDRIVALRDTMSRDWLQQRARGMLVPLGDALQQKSFVQTSYELYVLLFPEAVRRFMTPERTVHIVPTGPLYAMPFEVLVTALPRAQGAGQEQSSVHYLIEDVPIHYLSSASLLKTLREAQTRRKTTAPQPLLAFADPIYQPRVSLSDATAVSATTQTPCDRSFDTSTRGLFEALPETEAEVNAIKTLLKAPDESTPLQLREQATRTNVFAFNAEERLDDYRYVVFATHGVLPGQMNDLDQPALVLSYPEEDGFLTMSDVFQLRFNADLISLSACNTGSGERVRGEGVMGLTRAFMYAGTPTVAVTLWSVESFSAKALDVGLFEHLAAGQAPVEALRSIKLRMLRGEEGENYTHPYYWAPFVLFGDGR
jgi:CHAT domain-containing protein